MEWVQAQHCDMKKNLDPPVLTTEILYESLETKGVN